MYFITFDGVWHFEEVLSLVMNPGFHCTWQMADRPYGVVVYEWFAQVTFANLSGQVGLWYGQAYFMDNDHSFMLLAIFPSTYFICMHIKLLNGQNKLTKNYVHD